MVRVVQRVRAVVSAAQAPGAASPALRRRIALLGYGFADYLRQLLPGVSRAGAAYGRRA